MKDCVDLIILCSSNALTDATHGMGGIFSTLRAKICDMRSSSSERAFPVDNLGLTVSLAVNVSACNALS